MRIRFHMDAVYDLLHGLESSCSQESAAAGLSGTAVHARRGGRLVVLPDLESMETLPRDAGNMAGQRFQNTRVRSLHIRLAARIMVDSASCRSRAVLCRRHSAHESPQPCRYRPCDEVGYVQRHTFGSLCRVGDYNCGQCFGKTEPAARRIDRRRTPRQLLLNQ